MISMPLHIQLVLTNHLIFYLATEKAVWNLLLRIHQAGWIHESRFDPNNETFEAAEQRHRRRATIRLLKKPR